MSLIKPQNLDAERAVIRGLLLDYSKMYEMRKVLRPEMFFGVDNALVYQRIQQLVAEGKRPDVLLLKNVLENNKEYDTIGGDIYFELIDGQEYTDVNFNYYVELVANSYLLRRIIDAGTKISNAGYGDEADVALDTMFTETTAVLDDATFGTNSVPIEQLMADELDALLKRIENPGGDGLHTRFPTFDLLTGGLHLTDEVIVAARPSVGKTALALRWALNLASQGVGTAIFSYEMSRPQLMQRMLSMESGVSLMRIRNGMLAGDDMDRVMGTSNTVMGLPIYINSNVSASISEVVTDTKRLVRSNGVRAVILDYLQLMPFRMEFATQELGSIARRLKVLAMDANIVVIALSQLNRLVEARTDKKPLLADLRQSGNLEEHADMVIMLHREEMYNRTDSNAGKADLIIRKNRNGPIGELDMRFCPNNVDFVGTTLIDTLGG